MLIPSGSPKNPHPTSSKATLEQRERQLDALREAKRLESELEVMLVRMTGPLKASRYGAGLDKQKKLEDAYRVATGLDHYDTAAVQHAGELLAKIQNLRWGVVCEFSGMISQVAAKWCSRDPQTIDDAKQLAMLGAYEGAKRFDPYRGILFSTYVRWWMKSKLNRELANPDISANDVEHYRNVMKLESAGLHDEADIAHGMNCTVEQIRMLRMVVMSSANLSLETLMSEDFEVAAHAATELHDPGDVAKVLKYIYILPERQRRIIQYKFGLHGEGPETYRQIAARQELGGISRERVRQIVEKTLSSLKDMVNNPPKAALPLP